MCFSNFSQADTREEVMREQFSSLTAETLRPRAHSTERAQPADKGETMLEMHARCALLFAAGPIPDNPTAASEARVNGTRGALAEAWGLAVRVLPAQDPRVPDDWILPDWNMTDSVFPF